MSVDGSDAYPNDLMMDVCETQKTTVFTVKARILTVVLILLLGVFISFVPIRGKKEYYIINTIRNA